MRCIVGPGFEHRVVYRLGIGHTMTWPIQPPTQTTFWCTCLWFDTFFVVYVRHRCCFHLYNLPCDCWCWRASVTVYKSWVSTWHAEHSHCVCPFYLHLWMYSIAVTFVLYTIWCTPYTIWCLLFLVCQLGQNKWCHCNFLLVLFEQI